MNTSIPFFTKDWSQPMRRLWPEHVLPITNRLTEDVHWIEVGSFEGRTALWTIENVLHGFKPTITCIDVWEVWPYHDDAQDFDYEPTFDRNVLGLVPVIKRKGHSRDVLPTLPKNYYHGVFLDGSHEEADVLEDAHLSLPLLRTGGLLIFDDYDWAPMPKGQQFIDEYMKKINTGVRAAADKFMDEHPDDIRVLCREYQVICQKIS
jgi:predicted O-methyltransferase YrrM